MAEIEGYVQGNKQNPCTLDKLPREASTELQLSDVAFPNLMGRALHLLENCDVFPEGFREPLMGSIPLNDRIRSVF